MPERTWAPASEPAELAALVLAAGHGTRARAVTGGGSKVLLEVGGIPVLGHNLRWLAHAGVPAAWINLHFDADRIRTAIGTGASFGIHVRYSPEATPLGTAGALKHLEARWKGTVLVVYGDNLLRFDLRRFLWRHLATLADATIAVFHEDRNPSTGIAGGRIDIDADGRVVQFTEGSTRSDLPVNAGVYLLEQRVLSAITPDCAEDFGRDVFPRMLARGDRVCSHLIEPGGYCLGFDTPDTAARGLELVRSGRVSLA
ncbi:MAG: nucleotidyltransferase family protein [Acidobacteriota bacterium]